MSAELRVLLVIGALAALTYSLKSIRKSQFRIADSVFWLVMALATFTISLFPKIVLALTGLFHIQSPTNFVFLVYIGFLLYKVFSQSVTISKLNTKIETIAQKTAIIEFRNSEKFRSLKNK